MLGTQLALLAAIAALGFFDPSSQLWPIAWLCLLIAFLSATQDIVLDAYRRQLLSDEELGMGSSIHVNAYRIAGLVPGSLSLILADILPWQTVFIATSAFMLTGIGLTLSIREPAQAARHPTSLRSAVIDPFNEFFSRQGIKQACLILLFMLLYKLGDSMATALATPFYLDLGFTKTQIGLVAKNAALWPMIVGGILGGILMIRIGINRALWLFGLVQIISILGFAILARVGEGVWLLALAISFEYLGVGLGTAAFVAFIARSTHPAFAATQFALFTALTAVPRTVASSATGIIVEGMGWENFFYLCTALAIPGMLLLLKVAPWNGDQSGVDKTISR
jgi:PAT family beta-lactamase induction signal transducer AmpG